MTDRRSGPPLFDLMRDRGDRPDAPRPQQPKQQPQQPKTQPPASVQVPAKQVSQPAPVRSETRQTAWDSTGGVSRAERSAAAMLDEPAPRDTGISLSTTKFYSLVAIALVLIVAAWAGGYKIGFGDGKDSMSQFIQDEPVVSPPANNQPVNEQANTGTSGTGTQANTQQPQSQTQTQPPVGNQSQTGTILTPTGYRAQDPRTVGMNYLVLATLPTEQAADAIQFMQGNGVTVIGVPVLDSRSSSANNPSRYTLYSLGLAIPGNRWSAMSNQRLEHQQMVARLGAQWQRERRGGSDFSQTNWEKYEP